MIKFANSVEITRYYNNYYKTGCKKQVNTEYTMDNGLFYFISIYMKNKNN